MSETEAPLLQLNGVSVVYDGHAVIDDLSLEVGRGEFVVIHGSTGCGKSTILRLFAGLIDPTKGEVVVAGDRIDEFDEAQRRWLRRSMGLMMQEELLLEDRTVLENVMLPALAADETAAEGLGKEITVEHLAEIFLNLQAQGAHNINLVTPGQWQPWIIAALDIARAKGLRLPIVCNTGGYETVESVEAWRGYIDIWLADLKYVSSALSAELSAAPDYFAEAKPAIEAMMAQAGHPVFDADGILQKGVILRHLALPGHVEDSFAVLDQMAAWNDADPGCFLPSVMSQYTPFYKAAEHGIGRRITTYEYRRVVNYAMDKGLVQGYMQQKSSAKEEYTPSFDLTGV